MERETRNDGLLEIFPRIPNYTGRVVLFEGEIPIHEDKFNWVFYPKGQKREIPVYSIWNYDNHREITELIARGKAAALYMWGTYGTGMLLDSPQWQEEGEIESEKLRRVKKNRPWGDQFIDFMHPDDMIDFWDIDRFHPNFHRLQWAGDRWQLFEAGPVHIIAPTKPRNPHIDPSLFRESNQTSSYFFLPHPALIGLIELIRKDVKHSIFGGGSLNIHGESPPFTTEELHTMLSLNEDWQQDIDLVIVDEITEFYEIFRSQLQIRIPQRGSDGICEVVRVGGLDPDRWSRYTGLPVKDASEAVKKASSATPYSAKINSIIDQRIQESTERMNRLHKAIKDGSFN